MPTAEAFWFKSPLFKIQPGEDSQTNPGIFGKELADWLAQKLRPLGYPIEVIPEDWGWCVICQRKPARLFIGCGNVTSLPPEIETPELVWHVFVHAEVPIVKRLFRKVDPAPMRNKLATQLGQILANEPQITLVEEP
jgi:hypothetical protein